MQSISTFMSGSAKATATVVRAGTPRLRWRRCGSFTGGGRPSAVRSRTRPDGRIALAGAEVKTPRLFSHRREISTLLGLRRRRIVFGERRGKQARLPPNAEEIDGKYCLREKSA
jgi:hypothetical protein